jgi:hypothetical protein
MGRLFFRRRKPTPPPARPARMWLAWVDSPGCAQIEDAGGRILGIGVVAGRPVGLFRLGPPVERPEFHHREH